MHLRPLHMTFANSAKRNNIRHFQRPHSQHLRRTSQATPFPRRPCILKRWFRTNSKTSPCIAYSDMSPAILTYKTFLRLKLSPNMNLHPMLPTSISTTASLRLSLNGLAMAQNALLTLHISVRKTRDRFKILQDEVAWRRSSARRPDSSVACMVMRRQLRGLSEAPRCVHTCGSF